MKNDQTFRGECLTAMYECVITESKRIDKRGLNVSLIKNCS